MAGLGEQEGPGAGPPLPSHGSPSHCATRRGKGSSHSRKQSGVRGVRAWRLRRWWRHLCPLRGPLGHEWGPQWRWQQQQQQQQRGLLGEAQQLRFLGQPGRAAGRWWLAGVATPHVGSTTGLPWELSRSGRFVWCPGRQPFVPRQKANSAKLSRDQGQGCKDSVQGGGWCRRHSLPCCSCW